MATKKRETSDDVSEISGRLLAKVRQIRRDNGAIADCWSMEVPLTELAAVCASCLAQDVHKGKRPAKRKAKRR